MAVCGLYLEHPYTLSLGSFRSSMSLAKTYRCYFNILPVVSDVIKRCASYCGCRIAPSTLASISCTMGPFYSFSRWRGITYRMIVQMRYHVRTDGEKPLVFSAVVSYRQSSISVNGDKKFNTAPNFPSSDWILCCVCGSVLSGRQVK